MQRNRRRTVRIDVSCPYTLSVCVLFGHETRARTIRHVLVAFLWTKLSKWLAQCKRQEKLEQFFAIKIQSSLLDCSDVYSSPFYINKNGYVIFSAFFAIRGIADYSFRSMITFFTFRYKNLENKLISFTTRIYQPRYLSTQNEFMRPISFPRLYNIRWKDESYFPPWKY